MFLDSPRLPGSSTSKEGEEMQSKSQSQKIQELVKDCPFINQGIVDFPYRPLRDISFIWPQPKPTTFGTGILAIPEQFQNEHRIGLGILLAAGPGYFGREPRRRINGINGYWTDPGPRETWHPTTDQLQPGVVVQYDVGVPWYEFAKNHLGNNHLVVICGVKDIYGIFGK